MIFYINQRLNSTWKIFHKGDIKYQYIYYYVIYDLDLNLGQK